MQTISYLLLGEGDFTYSLDLCRYIASLSRRVQANGATSHDSDGAMIYSITCTGVDTLEELRNKYKDVDFVLRSIRQCSNIKERHDLDKHNTNAEHSLTETSCEVTPGIQLTAAILHGINAVQSQVTETSVDSATKQIRLQHFDRVMFHHPHLGTEDAQLHSRFLHHLFHAAGKRWLKPVGDRAGVGMTYGKAEKREEIFCKSNGDPPNNRAQGGLLYLTLVNGQCHRWKCIEAAQKHGLVLIRRFPFCPPPPPIGDSFGSARTNTTYYQLRRHQSGKSFAKRRRMQQQSNERTKEGNESSICGNDSETLVFGRACDYPSAVHCSRNDPSTLSSAILSLLPWEQEINLMGSACNDSIQLAERFMNNSQYTCLHCNKEFNEQRSLKNHMMNSHHHCKEVIAWNAEKRKKKKKQKEPVHTGDSNHDVDENREANRQSSKDTSATFNPSRNAIVCLICEHPCRGGSSNDVASRTFPHLRALWDHQRAKHFGSHSNIKPDWYHDNDDSLHNDAKVANNEYDKEAVQEESTLGDCSICGVSYASRLEKMNHDLEFVPSSSSAVATATEQQSTSTDSATCGVNNETLHSKNVNLPLDEYSQPVHNHECAYCTKLFRNMRDRLQHENYCSAQQCIDLK